MVQLVCGCLNIRVHAKGNELQSLELSDLHLSAIEIGDKFFQNKISKINLDLGGITKSQSSLCNNRIIGKWQIISCISCGMDVYATPNNDTMNQVLVNNQCECDHEKITSLMERSNYSPLFKMLLPISADSINENSCGSECAIQSKQLESAVVAVHQQVTSYLHHEQQAMEERIRLYISQQQTQLVQLQNKVHQDKQAMLILLLRLQEQDVNVAVVKAIAQNPNLFLLPAPPPRDIDSSSSSESTSVIGEQVDQVPRTVVHVAKQNIQHFSKSPAFNKSISRRRHVKRRSIQPQRMAQSIDALGLFNMEGMESGDDCAPFCVSDDGSTDESSATEDVIVSRHRIPQRYAASLPINVPVWTLMNHSSGSDEAYEELHIHDPEQVAASIKALSLSVKDDGTKMFGDLPPSQLTTADLLNSHPLLTGPEEKL